MQSYKQGLVTVLFLMGITTGALAYMKVSDPADDLTGEPADDILTVTTTMVQHKVMKGSDGRVSLAVNFSAMDIDPGVVTKAQPVDLVVVLDRSGSMEGKKINDAKEALLALLQSMNEQDRISLLTYSDTVQVLSSLHTMKKSQLQSLSRKVEKIRAGGGTNLGSGLQRGIAELRGPGSEHRQRKLILISDGHANQGVIDPMALGVMAANAAEYRMAVSTVGVGHGFNELMMTTIADNGTGNYYFLENPGSVARILTREFEASRHLVAGSIEIYIPLTDGVQLLSAGGYPISVEGNVAIIRPGDLMAGEQRKIFLTYRVPTHRERSFSLGTVRARYIHRDEVLQVSSPDMKSISCIDDDRAVLASIDKNIWSEQVVKEDYGRLKEEVATAIRSGKKEKAMEVIEGYEERNRAINSVVGSEIVQENLSEGVQLLIQEVEDTFDGSPEGVAKKQTKLAKTLQYQGYKNRRDKK